MKLKIVALFAALALYGVSLAEPNPYNMGFYALGVNYKGALQGLSLSEDNTLSWHESTDGIFLHYGPIEYTKLTFGLGFSRIKLEQDTSVRIDGAAIVPFGKLSVYTLPLIEIVQIKGDVEFCQYGVKDGKSKATLTAFIPSAGVMATFADMFNIEAGLQLRMFSGTLKPELGNDRELKNPYPMAYYTSIKLQEEGGSAFLSFDYSASLQGDKKWQSGPVNSSLQLSIGTVLRQDKRTERLEEKLDSYFPDKNDLKRRQEFMVEEIKSDVQVEIDADR